MRRDTRCRRRRKSCAEVETATAQQQQALYDYLRTIQRSFREVEDSLIATRKIREQQAAQDRQVQALQRTLRLASLRYENGIRVFWKSSTRNEVCSVPSSSRYDSSARDWAPSSISIKRSAAVGCHNVSSY